MKSGATLLLFCLSLSCAASFRLPSTPSGNVMDEFLEAYNTGKFTPVAAFFGRHGSKERATERAQWVMGFLYPGVRRFVPIEVLDSKPEAITVLGHSELTEAWYRFIIEVDSLPPHGVAFGFENADPPKGWQGREEDIGTYLRRLENADFFSGAVMIADGERTILTRTYGSVMGLDTQINLGSANKMFTAVAIMQLVEQGKLDLNTPVGRYLPDLPNPDIKDRVTIHHLLTHTSGVGDFMNPSYSARKKEIRTVAELLPFFVSDSLAFDPGAKWQYSNGGYALLGRVIEVVSGQSYEEYVQQHVFAPAGMTRTSGAPREPYAHGYTFMRKGGAIALTREVNDFALGAQGTPAGGGYSTVGDLVSFARALRTGNLVSKESLDRMLTPRISTDRNTQYGYGFELRTQDGETVYGHNGHHFGISAQFDVYKESGTIVAVLSNYDPPVAPVTAARIGQLIALKP